MADTDAHPYQGEAIFVSCCVAVFLRHYVSKKIKRENNIFNNHNTYDNKCNNGSNVDMILITMMTIIILRRRI